MTGCSTLAQQVMFTWSFTSITDEEIKTFAKRGQMKNSNLQKNPLIKEGDLF